MLCESSRKKLCENSRKNMGIWRSGVLQVKIFPIFENCDTLSLIKYQCNDLAMQNWSIKENMRGRSKENYLWI